MSADSPQFYAEIALPNALRRTFSYSVPPELRLEPGHRVRVPFGRQVAHGYVVGLSAVRPAVSGLRAVQAADPEERLVDTDILDLSRWVADYYLAPWGQVLDAALPPNVRRSGGRRRAARVEANPADPVEAADAANDAVGEDVAESVPTPVLALTEDQAAAVGALGAALATERYAGFLLQGVTGSGKTEVYLRAAAQVVAAGGQVLLLVPEIAMGAQVLARVRQRFPGQVGLYHSQAGDGERRRVWAGARGGDLPVVVGTRSAVFVPLPRLRLVIVDEEHESAYKQEEAPRYHGRDVAIYRARQAGALAVLGSATPSLETWTNARDGKYQRLVLPSRIDGRQAARVVVVDMADREAGPARATGSSPVAAGALDDAREGTAAGHPGTNGGALASGGARSVLPELERSGGRSIFSPPLVRRMRDRMERREQVILFLNRRGHSTTVQCADCGQALTCAQCDVVLTYHKSDRRLRCHYCNAFRGEPERCETCGGAHFFYGGFGTQRIEEDLEALLPGARIARMDRDATRRKGAHARIVEAMEAGEIDVLLGTQMVAKGFDFPGVTLVGVLQADQEFLLPDFRAGEHGFQVLTQVAGRSGRGRVAGEVVVQTFQPGHYVIAAAALQDYERFAATELDFRRELGYPPFRRLVHLLVDGPREAQVESRAAHLEELLGRHIAERRLPVRTVGPAPMPISRLKGQYRWHLGLMGRSPRSLHELALVALEAKPPRGLSATRVLADVDPISMV